MSEAPYLVIMAGGSGTRFWPKSTAKKPKQLLSFGSSNDTLLGTTLKRFDGLSPEDRRVIVTTQSLAAATKEAVGPATHVLSEPMGRNTAPCVYWAARWVAERDPKAVMMVMPADHHMASVKDFRATLERAVRWATEHDDLVTLGIQPSRPETGYGYLKLGNEVSKGPCRKVQAFVEKPDRARAEAYVASGEYLWNGGMFLWRAETILKAFDSLMPEMKREWDAAKGDVSAAYPRMTATSIDYGIMEKAPNVVTFPLDCGWDDLGSWISLETTTLPGVARGPAGVVAGGEVFAVESSGNVIDAPGRVVALLGVKDLVVVEHNGVLMILPKSRTQDVKLVLDQVKAARPEKA
ncbi:MAG: NTP transferase domain-containing protein [Bdellovibrionales bacterium]|nr:NTP transferase domain-containing protein [Bdellovibrionales bacterium]